MSYIEIEKTKSTGKTNTWAVKLCKGKCPGDRHCYKEPGHKGPHTCLNAFGMRYPTFEQFPKSCCPGESEES